MTVPYFCRLLLWSWTKSNHFSFSLCPIKDFVMSDGTSFDLFPFLI